VQCDVRVLTNYHDPGEEGSAPAASNRAGDGEGGNRNPSMYNDELGKPPPLDPSMEDGAVTAPMPTPPLVGRTAAAADPPPSP